VGTSCTIVRSTPNQALRQPIALTPASLSQYTVFHRGTRRVFTPD